MAKNIDIKGIKIDAIPKWARVLILVLIPLLVGTAFYFLYVQDKQKQIAGLDGQIQKIQLEISKNEAKVRRLAALREQNEWLKQRLDDLKAKLPKESEIVELLRKVSEKGTRAGLEIVKWKPGTRHPNPNGLYDEIPVDVEVLGGYHDLGMFFNGISQLTRIVNISGINMAQSHGVQATKRTRSQLAGRTDLLSVSFKATTFAVSTAKAPDATGATGRRTAQRKPG